MHSLRARSLSVRALRNLAAVDVELGDRFNVVSGDNGQGKTSLLEALYLALTAKSFRTSRLAELCPTGDPLAITSVRAKLEDGVAREQSVGIAGGRRTLRVDGQRPRSLLEFASRSPVVLFSPSELGVSMGPGAERRKLLDRVALYAGVASFEAAESYTRALRERQRALETRSGAARDLPEWESLMVRHGLAWMGARKDAAQRLGEVAEQAFVRIAAPDLHATFTYAPSAPDDRDAFLKLLEGNRLRDAARGSATVGPHRDDLSVALDGAPARRVASQGQHRAIVLALKIAEIEVVARAKGTRPVLLLDDVSSELDRDRTSALFSLLRDQSGQVLLTTTRPDLLTGELSAPDTRRDFVIVRGAVRAS